MSKYMRKKSSLTDTKINDDSEKKSLQMVWCNLMWFYYHNEKSDDEKEPSEVFYKKVLLEKINSIQRKAPMLESLFNKVADLKGCNFIKKRLQHSQACIFIKKWLQQKCFPLKIEKFLRIHISKNICEWLLLYQSFFNPLATNVSVI